MDENMKNIIDSMTYQQLLSHWRFAAAGSPFFVGDVGQYYKEVMSRKKKEIGDAGHIAASKSIGW